MSLRADAPSFVPSLLAPASRQPESEVSILVNKSRQSSRKGISKRRSRQANHGAENEQNHLDPATATANENAKQRKGRTITRESSKRRGKHQENEVPNNNTRKEVPDKMEKTCTSPSRRRTKKDAPRKSHERCKHPSESSGMNQTSSADMASNDDQIESQTLESLFPPLISHPSRLESRSVNESSLQNWSNIVAKQPLFAEFELHPMGQPKPQDVPSGILLVSLIPLRRTWQEPVDSSNDNSGDNESIPRPHNSCDGESIPRQQPTLNHQPRIDMNKLRDRWWNLVRQKRVEDAQKERERERMREATTSSPVCSVLVADNRVVLNHNLDAFQDDQEDVLAEPTINCYQMHPFPLHHAILNNDEQAVRQLASDELNLLSRATRKQLGLDSSSTTRAADTLSPLQFAVYQDKPHLIAMLIKASPLAMTCDARDRTPLMLAAELGLESCISTLLHFGASLFDKDHTNGDAALHCACRAGTPASTIRLILVSNTGSRYGPQKWASSINKKGQTPLHIACEQGHLHQVEAFLSTCSASVLSKLFRTQDSCGHTPLLAAIQSESIDIVMSLLMWRSNNQVRHLTHHYYERPSPDDTVASICPLLLAVSTHSVEMVQLLLEFCDQSGSKDGYDKDKALYAAVELKSDTQLEIMRLLVEKGANPCSLIADLDMASPITPISHAADNGDIQALDVMLNAFQLYIDKKRVSRRQDPRLRNQPESFHEAIEAKENLEVNVAMREALVRSLFLGWKDGTASSCHLASSIRLYKRGTELNPVDIIRLRRSIESGKLLSVVDVEGGGHFATSYRHYGLEVGKQGKKLDAYDRSLLRHWSASLNEMSWMQAIPTSDIKCPWLLAERNGDTTETLRNHSGQKLDRAVIVAETKRFLVDVSIVSLKSAKLAAAIRFASSSQSTDDCNDPVVHVAISAKMCKWLPQHIYHGSVVSGWASDLLVCCGDLLELWIVADEFLCPSLLRECEMRLLSSQPFQCYCWSCCLAVRPIVTVMGNQSSQCAECLYYAGGPSRLLTANDVLDALAVSAQMSSLQVEGAIKFCPRVNYSTWSKMGPWRAWENVESSSWKLAQPFTLVKDAAIDVIITCFQAVLKSRTFQEQRYEIVTDRDAHELSDMQQLFAENVLLHMCLSEMGNVTNLKS